MATKLLEMYGASGFNVSVPDTESYELMRSVFASLGRATGPDGEFFVVRVYPEGEESRAPKPAEQSR